MLPAFLRGEVMGLSGLAKVLSGFLLAVALLVGGSYFAAQYVIAQFTAAPPKPMFPNDKPSPKPKAAKAKSPPAPSTAAVAPSPKATPSPKPTATDGYAARITYGEGLNLRQSPDRDAARIGGVDYNDRVVVLEESPDKEWQRVRLEGSNQEGWVRAGHTDRLN